MTRRIVWDNTHNLCTSDGKDTGHRARLVIYENGEAVQTSWHIDAPDKITSITQAPRKATTTPDSDSEQSPQLPAS